ncbi:MAG TPA: tetratricopeptide repeat protein [Thermoanaerobaculia bacterium]|nr:tetratricopeptide repeat protein [Thermoanaerobaculia bacterium]
MTRDDAFDSLIEAEPAPALPRLEFGRTLPFVKGRVPLEEIYRLSVDAEKPAELVIKAARSGPDELAAAMRALDGKAYRGFALLYAAQKASPLVGIDPRRALALASAIEADAATLTDVNPHARATTPAPRQSVLAEASLLRAQALLQTGEPAAAKVALSTARSFFLEAGDLGFGSAMCDYCEGQIEVFMRRFDEAESLLARASAAFCEYGQDHLVGRAEAATGMLFGDKGDYERALFHLDRAIVSLCGPMDVTPLTGALSNRGSVLTKLGRFDEARATYARALNLALRHGLESVLRFVRSGLAELDFRRGLFPRALRAFREIARESSVNGSATDVLFARLYVAECLGRTGQFDAMAAEVDSLRYDRKQTVFSPSPALGELFVCLDQGTIDADLVAHVRTYMQDEENGVERAYQPLRLVG